MKMFNDCSGPCDTCKTHYNGGCLVSHHGGEYVYADPGWIEGYREGVRRKVDKEAKQVKYGAQVSARVAAARALNRAGAAEAEAAEARVVAEAARAKAEIADVRSSVAGWMAKWMEKRAAGLLDKRPECDTIE